MRPPTARLIGEVTCVCTALALVPAIIAVGPRRTDTLGGRLDCHA
jgi:hypothetical protein